jgi:hypothetical protein
VTTQPELAKANNDREGARRRFIHSVQALEARLRPLPLIEHAAVGVGSRAAELARRAAAAARGRPRTFILIGGIAAGILARRHLRRLLGQMRGHLGDPARHLRRQVQDDDRTGPT